MIKIKPTQKVDPRDINAPNKYYARVVSKGTVDLERLSTIVSRKSTVTEADCYAVLYALVESMEDQLRMGQIVKLDRLGSFQVSVSSKAADSPEAITAKSVTSSKLCFRPDIRLKKSLKNYTYTTKR
ncbi:HU family DNA-binding protein [Wenyingzhuangia sp. IMCC45574]